MICPICREELKQAPPESIDPDGFVLSYDCPRCDAHISIMIDVKEMTKTNPKKD